jgi:hypothetical protein
MIANRITATVGYPTTVRMSAEVSHHGHPEAAEPFASSAFEFAQFIVKYSE